MTIVNTTSNASGARHDTLPKSQIRAFGMTETKGEFFMPSNLNSDSEFDAADDEDDARSTVSRASTTFSQSATALEKSNHQLTQQAVIDRERIAQLEAALVASQLIVAQATQALEAEAAAKRQAEAQVLAERTVAAEAEQRAEAAERQTAEERDARAVAENVAREHTERLTAAQPRLLELERIEAAKKAAEETRQAELLEAQRQGQIRSAARLQAAYAIAANRRGTVHQNDDNLSIQFGFGRVNIPNTVHTEQEMADFVVSASTKARRSGR